MITTVAEHKATLNTCKFLNGEIYSNNDPTISLFGEKKRVNRGFEAKVIEALKDIPVRMISYGGSNYNISVLVRKDDKVKALNALSDHLFKNK